MTHSTDVYTLVRWMAADFSNQAQAFENPPLFAHIRVCMRPLPPGIMSGLSLYLEQAYDFMLQQPYRTRVLNFQPQQDHILLINYTLENEAQVLGAARNPGQLASLTYDDLVLMHGCNIIVKWTGHSFIGQVEPGKACIVNRNGKRTYLDNEFEIDANRLVSYDRGRDPDTDELVWGSIAGPFEFERWATFEDEVSPA
jgi:hypothetical protein